jgi:hypothetical protein
LEEGCTAIAMENPRPLLLSSDVSNINT